MKNRQGRIFFWIIVSLLFLLLPGTGVFAEEEKTAPKDETPLAEIEGGSITMEEFRQRTYNPQEELMAVLGSPEGKERLLNELIQTRLYSLESKRLKINERADVILIIQDSVERILADYYLKEYVYSKIQITDEEIRGFMDKNPELFRAPESVHVRHILLRTGREAKPEEIESQRKKAEDILAKAKAGEDFSALVTTYSEDKITQKKNGDLGYIEKGRYGKEFDESVFNLKPGEISPVIRTVKGFHIFRLEDRRPAGTRSLSDVRPWITSRLMTGKEQEARDAADKELIEKYKVKIHKELLK
jgi:parvulin-like peptidyl-prolyl isomerase